MARPKKIVHFNLREYRNASGTASYRVTGTMPNGTRVRKNFADKREALKEIADLELEVVGTPERQRSLRTSLTQEELSDAESALLQAGGLTLSKIVSHYHALRCRALAKGVGLDEAIRFVETLYRPEIKSVTMFNAKVEFLQTRKSLTEKTRTNYESGLCQLMKPDPNKLVHAYTILDVERVVQRYSNLNSQRTYRRIFSVFFNWAVRHHYCLENPCDRLDKLPKDMSQIAMLSLDECKRLLYAAMIYRDGVTAATVAIGLFAGLRPSEIEDLRPEDIVKDRIRVSGGKLRRQLKRSVPIPPVLSAWLQKFPFEGQPKGWDYKRKKIKRATNARKWAHDIFRHTSITFQAERDKNEALTAYNNGTSKKMMDDHYRDTIDDEKTIAEFWSLTPAKLRAKPPKVVLEIKRRVDWPSKAALKKLVWQKPLIHAAKEIGVSDVALRKHCVKLGIELPRQGHWLRQST
jgi:integrase